MGSRQLEKSDLESVPSSQFGQQQTFSTIKTATEDAFYVDIVLTIMLFSCALP
jgi:hypothetical protein